MLNFIKKLFGHYREIIIDNTSWKRWFSAPEKQRQYGLDLMNCVIQAILGMIEAVMNFAIAKKKIPQKHLNFLVDNSYLVNGKVHLSKKFTSIDSRTSRSGNTVYKVVQSILENGVVPEALMPWEEDEDEWSEYYKIDNDQAYNIGKEFLEFFNFSFSYFLKDKFNDKIKKSPIAISVRAWVRNKNKYGNLYYKPNGADRNHLTILYILKDPWIVRDSYEPFDKKLHASNYPDKGTGVSLIIKNDDMSKDILNFLNENDEKMIFNNQTGAYGYILFQKLWTLETEEEKLNAIMDMKARGVVSQEGVHIADDLWQKLPKDNFSNVNK